MKEEEISGGKTGWRETQIEKTEKETNGEKKLKEINKGNLQMGVKTDRKWYKSEKKKL